MIPFYPDLTPLTVVVEQPGAVVPAQGLTERNRDRPPTWLIILATVWLRLRNATGATLRSALCAASLLLCGVAFLMRALPILPTGRNERVLPVKDEEAQVVAANQTGPQGQNENHVCGSEPELAFPESLPKRQPTCFLPRRKAKAKCGTKQSRRC